MPRVLVRLGRALQDERRYEEAIEAYQQGISRYPRNPLAVGALIPLASCFMALGPEYDAQAESALMQILEDSELFTPVAEEYRDAVFLLAGLYMRQERFEEAIPWLDEALNNYADDERIFQAELLSGNAFRLSAMAIKGEMEDPALVGEIKRLKSEFHVRLEEAARRYRGLINRLESRPVTELDAVASVYLQDARLYEAASLFEQGKYELALERYERAAWIYKDSTAALGAYVQIVNCYIFLGREREAASSLRRAQYLVETLPDRAFEIAATAQSRGQWRQYFDWVSEILVTEDVPPAAQELP
jgi:tetratricopeptide (TPR) repeat protein